MELDASSFSGLDIPSQFANLARNYHGMGDVSCNNYLDSSRPNSGYQKRSIGLRIYGVFRFCSICDSSIFSLRWSKAMLHSFDPQAILEYATAGLFMYEIAVTRTCPILGTNMLASYSVWLGTHWLVDDAAVTHLGNFHC